MAKSTALVISVLVGALGLFTGVLVMSSRLEHLKAQKAEAEKQMKQAEIARDEALSKLQVLRKQAEATETSLRTKLSEGESYHKTLEKEVAGLKNQNAVLRDKLQDSERESAQLKKEVQFFSDSKTLIKLQPDISQTNRDDSRKDILRQSVEFVDYKVVHQSGLFSEVNAYFQFRNNTHKTLTGVVYEVEYYDDFGDVLYKTEPLKHPIKLLPGETNSLDGFHWSYEEGFIKGTPYDKLKASADAGTIKVRVKILKASFADGSVIQF